MMSDLLISKTSGEIIRKSSIELIEEDQSDFSAKIIQATNRLQSNEYGHANLTFSKESSSSVRSEISELEKKDCDL